ncbi:CHIT1-like protein, partial [Mya arenaria]
DTANVHSALYSQYEYNVDRFLRHWVANGAPRSKLLMGLPLYGREFTLADINDNKIGANVTDGDFMPYYEICALINAHNITPVILSEERVPYFIDGNLWVGYDDRGSIREKAQYIRAEGLAGAMIWAIDLDDFSGTCGMGKYPLMNALTRIIASPIIG